jgi:hypothetical protein
VRWRVWCGVGGLVVLERGVAGGYRIDVVESRGNGIVKMSGLRTAAGIYISTFIYIYVGLTAGRARGLRKFRHRVAIRW